MPPSPGLLTILTLAIHQPLSCLSFTQPSLLVWFSLCSTTGNRASGLASVIVFVPLFPAHPARLLVFRCFHHGLPYLCCCLSSLPLRWAPPSPGSLSIRQGNVKNPGDTDTMSSICALRATLATNSRKVWYERWNTPKAAETPGEPNIQAGKIARQDEDITTISPINKSVRTNWLITTSQWWVTQKGPWGKEQICLWERLG